MLLHLILTWIENCMSEYSMAKHYSTAAFSAHSTLRDSFLLIASDECRRDLMRERYESDSFVYLPTRTMFTSAVTCSNLKDRP